MYPEAFSVAIFHFKRLSISTLKTGRISDKITCVVMVTWSHGVMCVSPVVAAGEENIQPRYVQSRGNEADQPGRRGG